MKHKNLLNFWSMKISSTFEAWKSPQLLKHKNLLNFWSMKICWTGNLFNFLSEPAASWGEGHHSPELRAGDDEEEEDEEDDEEDEEDEEEETEEEDVDQATLSIIDFHNCFLLFFVVDVWNYISLPHWWPPRPPPLPPP